MTSYTKDEIIPSTTITRNFGDILNRLSQKKLEKVAVIRNNKIEAVILPVESYENLNKMNSLEEQKELYNIIMHRMKNPEKVDFEDVLKEYNLNKDEL